MGCTWRTRTWVQTKLGSWFRPWFGSWWHQDSTSTVSLFAIPTSFVMEEMVKMLLDVDKQRLVEMVQGLGELVGANCEPEDIANAALYLASDDAKYMSDHNLVVDGDIHKGSFDIFKNLKWHMRSRDIHN
uniref:Uncharacterized protein n=1 Tax=Nelumbo nucifera TaxID=4432 RepID=A0A822XHW7_NELNU|nr:TPA_asm: hypothetical protein HUJ06_020059 [Nelumbo nucifera]